jgi:hypothetical protein
MSVSTKWTCRLFGSGVRQRNRRLLIGSLAVVLVMALGSLAFGDVTAIKSSTQLDVSTDVSGLALDGSGSAYCGMNSCQSVTTTLITGRPANLILAFCVINNDTIPAKIHDSGKHAWTLRSGGVATGVYEWYTTAATAVTSDRISCSTPAFLNHNLIVFAVSGASLSAPFDPSRSLPDYIISTTGGTPSAKVLLSDSPDFLFGLMSVGRLGCPYPTVGSGFTPITAQGSPPCDEVEYKIVSATGLHTVRFGSTGTYPYNFIVDAVRAS